MPTSGGVRVIVMRNGMPSSTHRSNTSSSGRYVSVIASYSQSSSRNSGYSGWRT
jgi:hypothetical protein